MPRSFCGFLHASDYIMKIIRGVIVRIIIVIGIIIITILMITILIAVEFRAVLAGEPAGPMAVFGGLPI